MMNWLRKFWHWLWRLEPETVLIVMRLADMDRVHPQQITARCSSCGEEVGVYPSGQQVMRNVPNVKLLCQVCRTPGDGAMLAPGAEREPMQSVRREP